MCTGIRVIANGGEVFWGRTMDLPLALFGDSPLKSSILSFPAGVSVKGTISTWETKYAAIGVGLHNGVPLYDGVNEKGLAGDLQVLMECTHDTQANIKARGQTPVNGEEFVAYVLTQFASVQEIRDAYAKFALSEEPCDVGFTKMQFPVHFSFVDPTGDGIVLEPVENGSFKAYDFLGVMANSPEYPWHQTNLGNYIGLNTNNIATPKKLNANLTLEPIEGGTGYGLFGLPGDYTSPSRFAKAAIISNEMDAFDAAGGINALYSAFRSVIIPPGLEHSDPKNPATDYTRYWSGYDLAQRKVYVQTGRGIAFTSKVLDTSLTEITYTEVDDTSDVPVV